MKETLTEFYTGKTIFTTGGAGFCGSFLLEVLLRCCPGIVRIYVLLRPKKGLDPTQRLEQIFKKKLFLDTCKNHPELLKKVHVIPGDISKPNLGMSQNDMKKICEEVTVVFHCAAVISFTKSYRSIAIPNVLGTLRIVELCRNLKKLDILIYTSTAYANHYLKIENFEEKVYEFPFGTQKLLDELENGTDESFAELVSSLEVKYNLKWPNSYVFSKCLTENCLLEKANDIPVTIIRPSIIFSAFKGRCPGYLEPGFTVSDLSVAVGKGYVRVILADEDIIFDIIPIDIVTNAHIIAAWLVATQRRPNLYVVHSTSGDSLKLKFRDYMRINMEQAKLHPLPNSFQEMSLTVAKSNFQYTILTLYHHYIPAVVFDLYLLFNGKKPRSIEMYRFFDNLRGIFLYFMTTAAHFEAKHMRSFPGELQPEEKELFYTELGEASFAEIIRPMITGSYAYDWNLDKLPQRERLRIVHRRTVVIKYIQRGTLLLLAYLIYLFISKLFF